jgi:hypothetical protein
MVTISRLPKTSSRIAATYFGTQNIDHFPAGIRKMIYEDVSDYIDITMGTGRTLYSLTAKGKPEGVGGNDRCWYAYNVVRSVLEWTYSPPELFDNLAYLLHPNSITPMQGVLWNRTQTNKGPFVNTDTAAYIDGLVLANPTSAPMLANLGRVILTQMTFRSTSWARVGIYGNDVSSIKPEQVWERMMRGYWRTRLFQDKYVKGHHVRATYGDARDAPAAFADFISDNAMFFANPAWDWKDTGSNPYQFFTYDLDEVLLQSRREPVTFWTRDNPQQTLDDLVSWFEASKQAGGKYFCLSTQSTNAPDPTEVTRYLNARYQPIWTGYVRRPSKQSHNYFEDWFMLYELR